MENAPAVLEPEAPELTGEIAEKRTTLVDQMAAIQEITTDAEAEHATRLIQQSKGVCKAIEDWFAPLVEAAHKAHKNLTTRRADSKADVESESGRLQRELNAFLTRKREAQEAERRRQEAEAQAQREAEAAAERERLEAERLAEAKRLEDEAARLEAEAQQARMDSAVADLNPQTEGETEVADEAARLEAEAQQAREAATAKLAEAIEVPTPKAPVIPMAAPVKPSTLGPSVKGTAVREVWKYEITDAKAIPREFLKVDEPAIAAYVKARKGEAEIAGVRVYSELETAIRK